MKVGYTFDPFDNCRDDDSGRLCGRCGAVFRFGHACNLSASPFSRVERLNNHDPDDSGYKTKNGRSLRRVWGPQRSGKESNPAAAFVLS
jgi:hypothetical protein